MSINCVSHFTCFRLAVLMLVTAPCTACTAADPLLTGTTPAQWRVTWVQDPSTAAIVSWSTGERGSSHSLRYGIKGDADDEGVRIAENGQYTGGKVKLYYHHVRLSGLKPSTAYEIQMDSDGEQSPVFYFVTAPATDRPFSILQGGDSRSDQKERQKVNRLMATLMAESFANSDPADDVIALAHGGDYIASGTNMTQWSTWLSDHESTTAPDGRLLPIIPTRGNHDTGKIFNEVFGFPADDLNYYAVNLSPLVRLVTLNTEITTAGDQATWLNKELKASRPKYRWLLAQYHRPAYPAVKAPGTALQSWVPLFERHNVDLVCEADGHTIKRTLPIRNNVHDETGIVYVGEGGMGVPQRTPKPERWYLQAPGMTTSGSHIYVLTFLEKELQGRCMLQTGEILDTFTRPVRDLTPETPAAN